LLFAPTAGWKEPNFRLWVEDEFFEPLIAEQKKVGSNRTLYGFDCADRRIRVLAMDRSEYLNLSYPVSSMNVQEIVWMTPPRGSDDATLLDHACRLRATKAVIR
jgi:hypothetical protein